MSDDEGKFMQFGFLGINYEKADLNIRDIVSFTDQKKIDFLKKADQRGIEQCMVLSTCNRSEIYFFSEEKDSMEKMCDLFQDTFSQIDLSKYMIMKIGEDAVSYLFRIAAGLESMVLGEDQILGQVKDALDFSRTMGSSGKQLNKVVRDAVTCAKKIKTQLKISEKPLSVSYIGIQKVKETCGIQGKNVLVIGSGKTAVLTLRYLKEYQARNVWICSRTLSHAAKVQEEFPEIRVCEYKERYQVMRFCDIVISATSSPHLIVRTEEFQPENPVVFLDLAAPRDIDIRFGNLPETVLYNLDTLKIISRENQKERERLVEESKDMIDQACTETIEWLSVSRMDETIASLQQRCSEIVGDSYEYLSRKMDLGQREQKILKKVLNASLQRLLKEPIQELKHLDTKEEQDQYKEIVQKLFQI